MKKTEARACSLVSIGMPVFNGASFVGLAIQSLLEQSYRNIELVVSDNASTDNTEQICRAYEGRDPRVRYIRHESNSGPADNFQFVLDSARGEYFMWAAADDYWTPDFVADNLRCLERNPDLVGSMSASQFGDNNRRYAGDRSILYRLPFQRQFIYLLNPGPNAIFYSLFRKAVLDGINIKNYVFLAGDWALISDLLEKGGIGLSEGAGRFVKRAGGLGGNTQRYRTIVVEQVKRLRLPLHDLYCHVSRGKPIYQRLLLFAVAAVQSLAFIFHAAFK